MYSCPSLLLLAVIVRVTGNGKCGFKDTVEVFAESLEGTPYANFHGYVDTLVAEMQPSLQGRQSPEGDRPHDGQRQPNSGGSARERWRRGTPTGRRPRASAQILIAYRLWAVPLAALTVLLVFSALQRRCAGLEKRQRASAAGGAFLRRLDPSLVRLWALCGGRPLTEEGSDTSPLLNPGAAEDDAPAGDAPDVLIPMNGPMGPLVAGRNPKYDPLIFFQIALASLAFLTLAFYIFYTTLTEGLALIPQNNVTTPGNTSTVGPPSEPPRTSTSTAKVGSQSLSLSTAGADASSGGHSAATSDVSAGEITTGTTDPPRSEDATPELGSRPSANSTAGAGTKRT